MSVLQEAARLRWPDASTRPSPGGVIPTGVLAWIRWKNQKPQTVVVPPSPHCKIPLAICNKLIDIVTKHPGCNIGHIQQLWRRENNDKPLDFNSLGFCKFSDLLHDVPGINLLKDGSTVTAHYYGIPPPPTRPYDQQQLIMMQQIIRMQMQLAAIASLKGNNSFS